MNAVFYEKRLSHKAKKCPFHTPLKRGPGLLGAESGLRRLALFGKPEREVSGFAHIRDQGPQRIEAAGAGEIGVESQP